MIDGLMWVHTLLLIAAGFLALSAFIVAKKPDAKAMIDKLVPFQALIGVGLLAVAFINMLRMGPINIFRVFSLLPLFGLAAIGAVFGGIILGFFFGMPQIAKWIPGESNAEVKAVELSKKIAPFQVIFGIAGIVFGLLALLYNLKVLKP